LEDPAARVLAMRAPDGGWTGFVAMRADVRGIARPLMDAALAHARAGGHDGVWLQVWEHNERARRFHEKCGFVAVGMSSFLFGAIEERDPVYQLLLDRTPPAPG
jgi:ribosomal protein S18 acetylase RimI-like enzyme